MLLVLYDITIECKWVHIPVFIECVRVRVCSYICLGRYVYVSVSVYMRLFAVCIAPWILTTIYSQVPF